MRFGTAGYVPLVGDWTGTGHAGIGMWDRTAARFYLRSNLTAGPPDITVSYGTPAYVPIVGDWNGDGVSTIGVIA